MHHMTETSEHSPILHEIYTGCWKWQINLYYYLCVSAVSVSIVHLSKKMFFESHYYWSRIK